jgi:flagella basal body P-ring formation protein FlgA
MKMSFLKMRSLSVALFLSTLLNVALAKADSEFQSHASIYDAVNAFIGSHMFSGDFEAELLPLDQQLRLPLCPQSLEITQPGNGFKPGRNTVGVSCMGINKWSIYMSAVIRIYQPVLVLTQGVQRGDILNRDLMSLERRDVSGLRGDFVDAIEQADGMRILRAMPAGAILSRKTMAFPTLIKKGDDVTISSDKPGFVIHMSGKALMDGAAGQKIRIKNQSSGRVIQATVLNSGLASVN